jgi:hypothetical protein
VLGFAEAVCESSGAETNNPHDELSMNQAGSRLNHGEEGKDQWLKTFETALDADPRNSFEVSPG